MIAYLEGRVLQVSDSGLILLTPGGVGYDIAAPTTVLSKLPAIGEEAQLYIHTAVAEKAIDLYGFASHEDREVFRTLISIDKLGPKKAMAILSHFDSDHLREIAFREDAAALATVPGIGPKSARQILWNLKDKVDKLGSGRTIAASSGKAEQPRGPQGEYFDALAGLKNLGYSEEEARPLLKEIYEQEPDLDAAAAIRVALKKIATART
ncbi:Holliday junction branch migration protein RuvA [Pseudodesulfovibrio senegalensis]|uniref:Holliday junction branch migration complex subunit RuvA n=1 Tax=Pseudodesulfovibrio senegalensis TaxID=1721087 RepID=A0A6N6N5R9_9BACT|nr:Holliday junction branch migration protein RuvA [Pseudodesulfovibrio senegalensis]KAB1443091.1 Holliday junction branch migration protein RuvA [Pseudodesulfovibrio senegalensis]